MYPSETDQSVAPTDNGTVRIRGFGAKRNIGTVQSNQTRGTVMTKQAGAPPYIAKQVIENNKAKFE